jgi:hypothetical protein
LFVCGILQKPDEERKKGTQIHNSLDKVEGYENKINSSRKEWGGADSYLVPSKDQSRETIKCKKIKKKLGNESNRIQQT